MYIDNKKFDYQKFDYPDAERLIKRDKEFLKEAYLNWIKDSVEKIVERQWEIDDIGAVEQSGDFVKLLKEAEFTYSLGAYTSTISLVGVCAEDLCRFFASAAGHDFDSLKQFRRINELLSLGALTQDIADKLHTIRILRNDCLHFNQGFKQKDMASLKADALSALNSIKYIYGEILGVIDYATMDASKFSEVIKKIAEEASGSDLGDLGIDEALVRTRNIFADAFGFDISMNNSGRPVYKTSIYKVDEIDLEGQPCELALKDLALGMYVIVDLVGNDVATIRDAEVQAGDVIAATLMSVPNSLEVTGSWRMWGGIRKLG